MYVNDVLMFTKANPKFLICISTGKEDIQPVLEAYPTYRKAPSKVEWKMPLILGESNW